MSHIYIFATIIFTVTSQLIIKWRMSLFGRLPEKSIAKIKFLLKALIDPFVIIAILFTLLAGMTWMAAMTKFEISYAYPYIGLAFILILILSSFFFHEAISINKVTGLILIIAGIIVSSR